MYSSIFSKKPFHFFLISFIFLSFCNLSAEFPGGYQYLSPRPGAKYVFRENNLIVRYGEPLDESTVTDETFTITGSKSSEEFTGEVFLLDGGKTIIFEKNTPYKYDETITVIINEGLKTADGKEIPSIEYSFETTKGFDSNHGKMPKEDILGIFHISDEETAGKRNIQKKKPIDKPLNAVDMNLPDDFPDISVLQREDPAPGYIFCSPFGVPFLFPDAVPYKIIMDNYGVPVFYEKAGRASPDFKVQPSGELTFFDGSRFAAYDSSYNLIKHYNTGNGYSADLHELIITPKGNRFMMSYPLDVIDLSGYAENGHPSSTVSGLVIQELDEEDRVIFQWRSWDHISPAESYMDLSKGYVDLVHGNAIEPAGDTALWISSRHISQITCIDRRTAEVIWRLGGKESDFEFVNDSDSGFVFQHDCRRLENGNIQIFDNRTGLEPEYSRVVEYELNLDNMTAVLVRELKNDSLSYGAFMGSARSLPNGNTIVGWGGGNPNITEFNPDGSIAIEMDYPAISYRVFKFDWKTTLFNADVESINLGNIEVNDTAVVTLYLKNNGDRPLPITGVISRFDEYYAGAEVPLEIEPQAMKAVPFYFSTTAEGAFENMITVNSTISTEEEERRAAIQIPVIGNAVESQNPPEVMFIPENESIDVMRMPEVKINFNKALRMIGGESIESDELKSIIEVREGDENGEIIEFADDYPVIAESCKLITARFADTLKSNTEYFLRLKRFLEDIDGNTVPEMKISFTTGEVLSVREKLFDENVRVFPSPAKDKVRINFGQYHGAVNITFNNINGKKLFGFENVNKPDIEFNIHEFSAGIYFVNITPVSGAFSKTYKIVKTE